MCLVVGYIERPDIAFGFLIPIYQYRDNFFFHELSPAKDQIIGFKPCAIDEYGSDEFIALNIGTEKRIGDSSFFVYKNEKEILIGSYDDAAFTEKLEAALRDVPPRLQYLTEELKALL